MTRWTWAWLVSLGVLIALVLTVPAQAVGCSGGPPYCAESWSFFGLVHRTGDSEGVLTAYKIAMLVVLIAGIGFVVLDVRARRHRKAEAIQERDDVTPANHGRR